MTNEERIYHAMSVANVEVEDVARVVGCSRRKLTEWAHIGRRLFLALPYEGKLRVAPASNEDAETVVTHVRAALVRGVRLIDNVRKEVP